MKVLSITAQKPHSTGSGTYLSELVNSFQRLGYEQAVVAGIYEEDVVSFPSEVAFYPVKFSDDFKIYGMSDAMPYPSSLYSEMNEEDLARFTKIFTEEIKKAVAALDPDIIYCHHLFILTAIVRELFPNKRVIGQCHGSDLRQFKNCPKLKERVKAGIASLDAVYALHEAQATEICELYGVSKDKVRVIGSGYNARLFNTSGKTPRAKDEPIKIIYAGKISQAKGVIELFDIVRELSQRDGISPFEIRIAGGCHDDEIADCLKSFLDEFESGSGKCTRADYLGLLDQDTLASEFKKADVFVLPSYFEGLGLVLIEAMASGLVPVTTRLPGIKEWIDQSIENSNIIYVDLPKMESIDKPHQDDVADFVERYADALCEAFGRIEEGFTLPNTASVSWDEIALNFTQTTN